MASDRPQGHGLASYGQSHRTFSASTSLSTDGERSRTIRCGDDVKVVCIIICIIVLTNSQLYGIFIPTPNTVKKRRDFSVLERLKVKF